MYGLWKFGVYVEIDSYSMSVDCRIFERVIIGWKTNSWPGVQ